MTPYQMADAECANFQKGNCAGTLIAADLRQTMGKHGKCVLADNQRCQYFEDCVLPMVKWTAEPHKAKSFMAAVEIYNNLHKLQGSKTIIRVCPGCGGELLPRKRYCPTCQIKRRKSTFRNSQAAKRQNGGQGVNS